jgi:ABC-type transport system substrate-binding protein
MILSLNLSVKLPFLISTISLIAVLSTLIACHDNPAWNNPYNANDDNLNIYYSSFSERPKHLDPARSYSASEWDFISQIYEPPLQYHFLHRPYQLTPLTTINMPTIISLDKQGNPLTENSDQQTIAFTEYHITLRHDIYYQPHPALAMNNHQPFYQANNAELTQVHQLSDFSQFATRKATAADYIYQIKRLAYTENHSPIAGLMAKHILGFNEFSQHTQHARIEQTLKTNDKKDWLDLRPFSIEGVKFIDDFHFSIRLKGRYPQFQYWLAMNFFAPMPWEAEYFYHLPYLAEKNISLDWYPIGTGPYMLTENNPNLRMVLERNPHFHSEKYPTQGTLSDQQQGFLNDANTLLPFIDKAIYTLEKEAIPRWNKFLQGYYDTSGINSDSFDQAVQFNTQSAELTPDMRTQNIHLLTAVEASTFYLGFNMKDDIVGGDSQSNRQLRQAIAIAVDYEEYISIFQNGRGIVAHSPLPIGIFGYQKGAAGINPIVYDNINGKAVRKSITFAKKLLAQAGYPNGVDSRTNRPLILHYDTMSTGPDSKALLNWYRKQFKKLGIQLNIRSSDYNRFQEKMRKGTAQLFSWGWNADYPDPENFLFLLYGPNGKVDFQGENAANYNNAHFNHLFEQMNTLTNNPQRLQLINQMIQQLQQDSPWLFGFHPKQFSLYHHWYHNAKPNLMGRNTLKYRRIDPSQRQQQRQQWNTPILWPLWTLLFILSLSALYGWFYLRQHEKSTAL